METCLIVCWDPSGIETLRRCRSDLPLVVASENPRVQESARGMAGVADVTYIERGESFWTVAADVKTIVGRVDEWLWSLAPSLPRDALAWGGNVEGGLMGQRIQDALLLIRSYTYLFRTFDVREVQAVVDPSSAWAAEVLQACARARSIPVECRGTGILGAWTGRVARGLAPFARAGYFLLREVMLGAARPRGSRAEADLDGAIVFQVCSSLQKHVDNVTHLMAALVERGERAVGLCWDAGDRWGGPTSAERLRAAGIAAASLERFVSAGDMVRSLWRSAATFVTARRRRGALGALEFEGVPVAPLLAESIGHFMVATLPARLRYASAFQACLGQAKPAAIKPWGGGDRFEGRLALGLTHRDAGSMYIHYWVGVGIPGWPYTDLTYTPDLFLAKSPSEAALARDEYRLDDAQVRVVGQARWAHLRSFGGQHAPEESRRQLKLPLDGYLYVGVDPNVALRGYQSCREQVDQLVTVLKIAREVPGVVVAIKPHPGAGIEHLVPFIQSYRGANVVVLPRSAPAEPFLNAVDILVTKYSTLILEAALLGRCSIAALLDGEDRFQVFGDLAAVVRSPAELHDLLCRLGSDPDARRSWISQQRACRQEQLPHFYWQATAGAPALAADAIITGLRMRPRQSSRSRRDER